MQFSVVGDDNVLQFAEPGKGSTAVAIKGGVQFQAHGSYWKNFTMYFLPRFAAAML